MQTMSMTMRVSGGTRRRLTPLGPRTSMTSSQVRHLINGRRHQRNVQDMTPPRQAYSPPWIGAFTFGSQI
jgi:hypothetical protein